MMRKFAYFLTSNSRCSDKRGIGHAIVHGVAAGFDLAPGLQDAIVGVVEATINSYLQKKVDGAVSLRVRDRSTSRASNSSSVTATSATAESAASDSDVPTDTSASPPSSPASVVSVADVSPMDTASAPTPLPSSAVAPTARPCPGIRPPLRLLPLLTPKAAS
ncbi:hypothetical protein ACJJTC_017288 [Scirpophaga incertulas]